MITIEVRLETVHGVHGARYEKISISKDELLQIACDKAKEKYQDGFVKSAEAHEVEIQSVF